MDSSREKNSPFVTSADGKPLEANPLRDPRVRRAISKMIDRDAIVSRIMEGQGVAAGQLLPDQFFGTSKTLTPDKYDPAAAKKLLAEAGYPNGFGLTLHAPNNRYINDAAVAQAVAQFLSRNGIATKLETMPSNVFFSRGSKLEFSFLLAGWGAETGETSSPLRALLATFDTEAGAGHRQSRPLLGRRRRCAADSGADHDRRHQARHHAGARLRKSDRRNDGAGAAALRSQYLGHAPGRDVQGPSRPEHVCIRRAPGKIGTIGANWEIQHH